MSLLHNLKKIHSIKSEIKVLWHAFRDVRTPTSTKIAATFIAFIYIASPVDIAPDLLPLIGITDDIMIIPLLLWVFIPNAILDDARKHVAQQEGKKVHKHHWMFWSILTILAVFLLYTIYKLVQ